MGMAVKTGTAIVCFLSRLPSFLIFFLMYQTFAILPSMAACAWLKRVVRLPRRMGFVNMSLAKLSQLSQTNASCCCHWRRPAPELVGSRLASSNPDDAGAESSTTTCESRSKGHKLTSRIVIANTRKLESCCLCLLGLLLELGLLAAVVVAIDSITHSPTTPAKLLFLPWATILTLPAPLNSPALAHTNTRTSPSFARSPTCCLLSCFLFARSRSTD